MKTKPTVFIFLIIGFCLLSGMTSPPAAGTGFGDAATPRLDAQQISSQLPLYFIPNQGQFDGQALFLAHTPKYKLWVTRSGLLFDTTLSDSQRSVSAIHFPGARKGAAVEASGISGYRVNYMLGNDPGAWRSGIPASRAVLYEDLYENVDLKLYGQGSQLEYDWVVKPGGDPARIKLAYEGAKNVEINDQGDLLVDTGFCTFVHKKPHAYQTIQGKETTVEAFYRKIDPNTFSFSLGSYDASSTLTIDPLVFVYATFLGGSELDEARDIAVDAQNRPYIVGTTRSLDFPVTPGVYGPVSAGGRDVFVTRFTAGGNDLLYSTFIGGGADDEGFAVAIDPEGLGYAYITGRTRSADFPTTAGAYDRSINGGRDIFVAKLSRNGSALMLSTFAGGSSDDNGYGITLDQEGAIYVTGSTSSADFPTTERADDRTYGGNVDAFAIKMDGEASSLVYSTYIGDVETEECFDIAVNPIGCAYVTGYTDPGENADSDVLAVKLNIIASIQVFQFIFGGSQDESGRGITVDDNGFAYIVGWTESDDFPTTPDAFDRTHNGHTDAFVSKLKSNGSDFVFSTYLGGSCWDWGEDIDYYEDLSPIVTGYTTAEDFPVTPDAFDSTQNGKVDAFVTKFDPPGSFLKYSTYLGGEESDYGMGIAVDSKEFAHTTGFTLSEDFPVVPKAYDDTFNLVSDGYYVKFALIWPISITITYPLNGANVAGVVSVETEVEADGQVANVEFYVDDDLVSVDTAAPYGFDWDTSSLANGAYKIKALATDTDGYKAYHQITALLLNGTLDLQVERDVYKTWLFERHYAELTMTVLSSDVLDDADYYAFFRKADDEDDFVQVRAFPEADLVNDTITFRDIPLDGNKTYTFYVLAVSEAGEIFGISPEITK